MEEFFKRTDLIRFYLRFILNKRRIITDCKEGRLQLFIVELLWPMRGILGLSIYSQSLIYKNFFRTKNGDFLIHRDLQSAITVSPTFESDDHQELLRLIGQYVKRKDKILFIDVGAHVGVYSISVGRHFKSYKNIDIVAFEPNANNFYKENSLLFLKNINLNKLNNIKLFEIGLGQKNTNQLNKFGFAVRKLDSILSINFAKKFDAVFIKIDIEGYEEEALRGSKLFIKNSKTVYFMIEDCVNQKILKYMDKNFKFYKKISPYNSFWIK